MIFGNDIVKYEISKIKLLDVEQASKWLRKPYWYWYEAICLSIGCCPDAHNGINLDSEESLKWGKKFLDRAELMERAMLCKDLYYSHYPISISEQHVTFPAFNPSVVISWLKDNNYEFPEVLSPTLNTNADSVAITGQYIFRNKLKSWHIKFDECELDGIEDLLGLSYIKLLLQSPHTDLHVTALESLAGGQAETENVHTSPISPRTEPSEENNSGGENLSLEVETPQPVLDERAVQEYKEEISRLNSELDYATETGDSAKEKLIRDQIDFLQNELNANTGLHGRFRHLNSQHEKARKRVSNAIKKSIDKIEVLESKKANCGKKISNHLKTFINKGVKCKYSPYPNINWQLN